MDALTVPAPSNCVRYVLEMGANLISVLDTPLKVLYHLSDLALKGAVAIMAWNRLIAPVAVVVLVGSLPEHEVLRVA